jgi:hypothetical protein
MGKYTPLRDHLAGLKSKRFAMTFAEIEKLIEAPLPRSAHIHEAWWSANVAHRSQDHAWVDAGWRVEHADRERKFVTFVRA